MPTRPRWHGYCSRKSPNRWRSSPGTATSSSWSASAPGSARRWPTSGSPFRPAPCPPVPANSASSSPPSRTRRRWRPLRNPPGEGRPAGPALVPGPLEPPRNEVQAARCVRIHPPERARARGCLDIGLAGGGHIQLGAIEDAVRGVLAETDLLQDVPLRRDHGDALGDGGGHEQPPVGGERHAVRDVLVGKLAERHRLAVLH